MSEPLAYYMFHAGAIPGVPGPNNGLWPAGITVYVDPDTLEVLSTSLIGGNHAQAPEENAQPLDAPAQAPADQSL